jgi:mannonate dehydratase
MPSTDDAEFDPSAIQPPWPPAAGREPITITDVTTVCTAPEGIRLVLVKVQTSDAGLHGWGCATFTQRPLAVVTAVEQYLRPFLVGRNPDDIEDIWQAASLSSYWRSGPVLNNALAGVDMALWDIKGKRAGLPVHQLFGGRTRRAADVYVHAHGRDLSDLTEQVRRYLGLGFRHVRCQVDVPGYSTYGQGSARISPDGAAGSPAHLATQEGPWEPRPYCRTVPRMFDHLRSEVGDDVELLHDVHERVPPIMAIQLAKDLEPYQLFFLEDVVSPEDSEYLRMLRGQCSTPIAMGELYVNQHEYVPVVRDRLIDFIRVHLSDIGGLTPARKLAVLCEYSGVRTAWHGPGDASPVAHAANLALDLSSPNFGIQETPLFSDRTREVFPGCPEIRNGAMWSDDRPGLGIEVDEKLAARYPFPEHPYNGAWPEIRRLDGTVIRP